MIVVELAGLKWQEEYNCFKTYVSRRRFPLSFQWNEGSYEISINGQKIGARASYPELAALIAVAAAHQVLREVKEALPSQELTRKNLEERQK